MAFPTTQMSGYVDLNGRISLALSRCQEQPWLDFKESQPWPMLRWRLLKTIMGMANLRDGGPCHSGQDSLFRWLVEMGFFFGRPRARSVDSRSSRRAIDSTQFA